MMMKWMKKIMKQDGFIKVGKYNNGLCRRRHQEGYPESFDYEANEISRIVEAEYKKIDEEELLSCNKVESNDHNLVNDQNNINNSFDQNNNKANEIV